MKALGVYRETQFSPGKIEADAAILDSVLAELAAERFEVEAVDPVAFLDLPSSRYDLVLAMCQGGEALARLAMHQQAGSVVVNSALAIRNCYRDLLSAGLQRSGIPTPPGVLIGTEDSLDRRIPYGLDSAAGLYVKRGDLHALHDSDVVRVEGVDQLRAALMAFAARGIKLAYVQQGVAGSLVKFYGVSGGEYFATVADGYHLPDLLKLDLARAAATAADALGLEAWGGDAVVHEDGFKIIDFNDWPSFSRVRVDASRAIARRCLRLHRSGAQASRNF
jgi:glutathione synthase/RimK-type ligase-like ATP-grasp enzyme